jgi:hypothetical protein
MEMIGRADPPFQKRDVGQIVGGKRTKLLIRYLAANSNPWEVPRIASCKGRAMADDKPSPRRGRKPPQGEKRQFLTTMDPHVIRAIKQVALDLDRTASDLMEEAAKQWLERHKHKK